MSLGRVWAGKPTNEYRPAALVFDPERTGPTEKGYIVNDIADFVEGPGTRERDASPTTEECCESEAGDWLCTRISGHEMPHQAGCGFEGSEVYAEWADAEAAR